MAIINNEDEVLHRVRVKLYPNHLPRVEGAYVARTDNEAALTVGQVCAALKNRGGFTGSYDDLVEHVEQFFDEAAYQLCDGFSVNTGYFSIHPSVGGTFDSVNETHDKEKHPVGFRFRTRAPLRALVERIVVEIEGLADSSGYIYEFIDLTTGAVNETLTPGGMFSLSGHKIKIFGKETGCGVYFAPEAEPAAEVKVEGHLAENTASKIIGVIPPLTPGAYKVIVKTQFTGSGATLLKTPRLIESAFTLTIT
jgi:hypothetical protein